MLSIPNNKESICISPKLNLSSKSINPNTQTVRNLLWDTERTQISLMQEKGEKKKKPESYLLMF